MGDPRQWDRNKIDWDRFEYLKALITTMESLLHTSSRCSG